MSRPAIPQVVLRFFKESQTAGPILLALVIGVCAGVVSVGFHDLLEILGDFFFGTIGNPISLQVGIWYPILVVGLGGLLVGIINQFLTPKSTGQGIPEIMYSVAYTGGQMSVSTSLRRGLAGAICIGSGGSGGAEGSIMNLTASVGSFLGRLFHLTDRRVVLCVACGTASGMAATFNAPIAGVLFALEVILARFTATSFGTVVISSITATMTQRLLTGNDSPAFVFTQNYTLNNPWELLLYAVLGVISAFAAVAFSRGLFAIEKIFDWLTAPAFLKPAIGAALVGAVGIYEPKVFSTGYGIMGEALSQSLPARVLFAAFVLKILATTLTVGSGGPAGVFSPSLLLGAMLGGAYGKVMHFYFPDITAESGAYVIVGMAAVFAGAAHAPITAILMLFEMTNSYDMIIPLMMASSISLFIAQRVSQDSMYTYKLRKRGIDIRAVQDIDLMDSITAEDAMDRTFEPIPHTMTLPELVKKFSSREQNAYPVVDDAGVLCGIVTRTDMIKAVRENTPDDVAVGDICSRDVAVIRPEQSLTTALTQFGARHVRRLPVVDPANRGRVIGMLGPMDVIRAYIAAYGKAQEHLKKVDKIHAIQESSEAVLVQETIHLGAALAGKQVKDACFPPGCSLISIRRGDETIVPRGITELHQGDVLLTVTHRDGEQELRQWLRKNC